MSNRKWLCKNCYQVVCNTYSVVDLEVCTIINYFNIKCVCGEIAEYLTIIDDDVVSFLFERKDNTIWMQLK